ncbi:hypothetical protein PM082_024500 [Marasmius tenuissimus]|nr:hypothetical protein PM082_024500 [Marasmius tenuissimus]
MMFHIILSLIHCYLCSPLMCTWSPLIRSIDTSFIPFQFIPMISIQLRTVIYTHGNLVRCHCSNSERPSYHIETTIEINNSECIVPHNTMAGSMNWNFGYTGIYVMKMPLFPPPLSLTIHLSFSQFPFLTHHRAALTRILVFTWSLILTSCCWDQVSTHLSESSGQIEFKSKVISEP